MFPGTFTPRNESSRELSLNFCRVRVRRRSENTGEQKVPEPEHAVVPSNCNTDRSPMLF